MLKIFKEEMGKRLKEWGKGGPDKEEETVGTKQSLFNKHLMHSTP